MRGYPIYLTTNTVPKPKRPRGLIANRRLLLSLLPCTHYVPIRYNRYMYLLGFSWELNRQRWHAPHRRGVSTSSETPFPPTPAISPVCSRCHLNVRSSQQNIFLSENEGIKPIVELSQNCEAVISLSRYITNTCAGSNKKNICNDGCYIFYCCAKGVELCNTIIGKKLTFFPASEKPFNYYVTTVVVKLSNVRVSVSFADAVFCAKISTLLSL